MSVYVRGAVHHFKSIQNHHDSGHISYGSARTDKGRGLGRGVGGDKNEGAGHEGRGIKEWMGCIRSNIEEAWIASELDDTNPKSEKEDPSSKPHRREDSNPSVPSPMSSFKVKILLRTRADGPTKVLELIEDMRVTDGGKEVLSFYIRAHNLCI